MASSAVPSGLDNSSSIGNVGEAGSTYNETQGELNVKIWGYPQKSSKGFRRQNYKHEVSRSVRVLNLDQETAFLIQKEALRTRCIVDVVWKLIYQG